MPRRPDVVPADRPACRTPSKPSAPVHDGPSAAASPSTRRRDTRRARTREPSARSELLVVGGPGEAGAAPALAAAAPSMDPEKELEAWLDFAAEHYEMVEQLPLELHRNFRLLKELDEGCVAQQDKLHRVLREYIGLRLRRVKMAGDVEALTDPAETGGGEPNVQAESSTAAADPSETADTGPGENDMVPSSDHADAHANGDEPSASAEEPTTTAEEAVTSAEDAVEDALDLALDEGGGDDGAGGAFGAAPAGTGGVARDELVPVPDGRGGLLVVPAAPARPHLAFPPDNAQENGETSARAAAAVDVGGSSGQTADGETEGLGGAADAERRRRKAERWALLPEISKLSRELVRNCEEKVAIAVGAYNSIDRHIRALDSALASTDASIVLGLRPATLPSARVDQTLGLEADAGAVPESDEIVIGVRGRKKKGKKGRKEVEEVEVEAATPGPGMEIEADPSEPRYCYCNNVSFGEMVGCDNDDCPLEWFHLGCIGLQTAPTGKWFCDECRPSTGLGRSDKGAAAGHRKGAAPAGKKRKR